jgi:hypothetical protein
MPLAGSSNLTVDPSVGTLDWQLVPVDTNWNGQLDWPLTKRHLEGISPRREGTGGSGVRRRGPGSPTGSGSVKRE